LERCSEAEVSMSRDCESAIGRHLHSCDVNGKQSSFAQDTVCQIRVVVAKQQEILFLIFRNWDLASGVPRAIQAATQGHRKMSVPIQADRFLYCRFCKSSIVSN
jgi:hypothetical protein